MVQLECDEELGPLHGMYGSMEAEYEVQRTIKRAELTAFLCLLRKVCGPTKVHVDNKGMIGERMYQARSLRCRPVDKNLAVRRLMSWHRQEQCWMKASWKCT